MVRRDADEVLPGLTTDEHVILLQRDKEDVDVEGGQVNVIDIQGCDVLSERRALRWVKSVGVGVDFPERHSCCVD